MALVTPESVAAAAEKIQARGEKPTIDRVKAELGGGSPNPILKYLNAWRDAQAGAPPPPPEPDPEQGADIVGLDRLPEVERALDVLTSAVLGTVNSIVDHERAKAATDIRFVQASCEDKINTVRKAADQQCADISAKAAGEIAEVMEAMDTQEGELQAVRNDVAALIETVAVKDTDIAAKDALISKMQVAHDVVVKHRDETAVELSTANAERAASDERAVAAEAKAADLADQLAAAKSAAKGEADRLAALLAKAADDAKVERDVHAAAMEKLRAEIEAMRAKHAAELDALTTAHAASDATLRSELALAVHRAEEAGRSVVAAGTRIEALVAEIAKAVDRAEAAEARADRILAGFAATKDETTTGGQKGKPTPTH